MWWLIALAWPWEELESPRHQVRSQAEVRLVQAADTDDACAQLASEALRHWHGPAQTRQVARRVFRTARRRIVLSGRADKLPRLSPEQAQQLALQLRQGKPGSLRRLHLLVLRKENAALIGQACDQLVAAKGFLELPPSRQRAIEELAAWCRPGYVVARWVDGNLYQLVNLADGRPFVLDQTPLEVHPDGNRARVGFLPWLPPGSYPLEVGLSHDGDVPGTMTVLYRVESPLERARLLYSLARTPRESQLAQLGHKTWRHWDLRRLPPGWWNVVQCLPPQVNSRYLPKLLEYPDDKFRVDSYIDYYISLHHQVCQYLAQHGTPEAVAALAAYGARCERGKQDPFVNLGYAAALAILRRYPDLNWLRRLEQSEALLYEDQFQTINVSDTARGLRLLVQEVPLHREGLEEIQPRSLSPLDCVGFVPRR